MDPATMVAGTFLLKTFPGLVPVPFGFSTVGRTATLRPSSPLAASQAYQATVTTAARDVAGNALAAAVAWTFQTSIDCDSPPPPES